MNRFKILQ